MLDLGFIHALKRIVTLLPTERQSLFFSATMPKTIATLADAFLRNPAKVAVTPVATTAERVEQSVMFVPTGRKQALLETVLRDPAIERVLVFTPHQARRRQGRARPRQGGHRRALRSTATSRSRSASGRSRRSAPAPAACWSRPTSRRAASTSTASRHVINYDLPNVPESYVHRIGRTARAGATGRCALVLQRRGARLSCATSRS